MGVCSPPHRKSLGGGNCDESIRHKNLFQLLQLSNRTPSQTKTNARGEFAAKGLSFDNFKTYKKLKQM